MNDFFKKILLTNLLENHPVPWKKERKDLNSDSMYLISDAKEQNVTTLIDEPKLAHYIVLLSHGVKRAEVLALILRELIVDIDSNHPFDEILSRAQNILQEGKELEHYDKELDAYLKVFANMRTRREIEEEISKSSDADRIAALQWVLSEEKIQPKLKSPFRKPLDGSLDSEALCRSIDADHTRILKAFGLQQKIVEFEFGSFPIDVLPPEAHPKAANFFEKLEELYLLIVAANGKLTVKEFIDWFKQPSPALQGKSPLDKIYELDIDSLIVKLKDIVFAAHGG